MSIREHNRQHENRTAVPQISTTTTTAMNDVVLAIDSEITPALRMRQNTGSDRIINIDDYTVTNSGTSRKHSIPPISNVLPTGVTFPVAITFPASSGGNITISGTTFSGGATPTLTVTSGNFIKVGFNFDATGSITLTFGTQGASVALATAPPTVDGMYAIGFVVMQNSGGTIQGVINTNIYQYVGSGGSGGSGSGNAVLETLKNEFVDSPYELLTPNIISTDAATKFASFSGASYDVANKVVKFSANAQIATSTQMLDSQEFLPRGLDVTSIDLSAFWNKGSTIQAFAVPDAATTYSNLSATTTNTSAVVVITTPTAHGLKTGSKISVTTATAIGGISSVNLTTASANITVLTPQTFSYTAGASASSTATSTLDTVAALGFAYEVSRDGGSTYFPVSMARVGTTDTYRGNLQFDTTATTEATYATLLTFTGSVLNRDLTASGADQQLSQTITVPSGQTWTLKQLVLNVTKTGTPNGNLFVSIVKDSGGLPSALSADVLGQSSAILANGLLTGANTITLPTTTLITGIYHIVVSSDAAYKATPSFASNKIAIQEANTLTGESSYNGTVWATVASRGFIYTLKGRNLDLRVRFTSAGSPTYPCGLDGYGIFYNLQDVGVVGASKKVQRFVFSSTVDNLSSFAITAFNPDPDLLTCWYIEAGQGFKVPAFNLNGNTAVFPASTFNNGGVPATVTLVFEQNGGGSFDNAENNALLLANNFLGSESGALDRSSTGRGIKIRNASGLLREISLDAADNIIINSLP